MRLHQLASIAVLAVAAWWVLTGEFSTVGSAAKSEGETPAATEAAAPSGETQAAQGEAAKLQPVGWVKAPQTMHARTIRIAGRTEADKRTDVAARVGGIVQDLLVEKGQAVKEGDVIMRVDPEARSAALKSAQQLLDQRQQELSAAEKLVKKGTLPKLQEDNARSALMAAWNQVESAQAELDRLEVKAPFSGIVDDTKVEKGASVSQGAPVATLIALDPVLAVGEVNEADLGAIAVGNKADVRLVTGNIVEGAIRFISRVATPATRTYKVEVEVLNPDLKIPAGMTTEIQLRGTPVLATLLPRSVLALSNSGEIGVRIVDAEDK
ncbi:MAG TPA: efflux RND transporter periplasmic adaptor subunit, partial [Rhizobiaceae bacterium]|nr:efflux RND transporter periplasmic adaptor subunit [Rhizobiaceae bacterium]